MTRPYVVCHMMGTVDGRIQTERWSLSAAANQQYEAVHGLYRADAWMCGRQTFQEDFLEQVRDAVFSRKTKVPSGDFIAEASVPSRRSGARVPRLTVRATGHKSAKPVYAIAVDASGKLRWESNDMRSDRLVVLTTGKAPSGYRADLRAKSIFYLVCGRAEIDFAAALARLHRHFGIRTLMLEGGGSLNGALLAAGLIDEVSLLVCPFADGSRALPTVFDVPETRVKKKATALRLMSAKPRPGGVVWLRYKAK